MKILTIILLATGWVALLGATAQPLLASIQLAAIGLGFIASAIVAAVWARSPKGGPS